MHQLRYFAIVGTAETFRQGVTYYRNARDWAKEQRDEAIRPANERAGECQAGTLAVDASFGQASSFASEATLGGIYTIEALNQEPRTSLTEDSNTNTRLQKSEASSGEPSVDYRPPVRRSSEHSKASLSPNGSDAMPATLIANSLSNLNYNHRSPPDFRGLKSNIG
jgi:hypothetical protein